jgi:hypothetical protein
LKAALRHDYGFWSEGNVGLRFSRQVLIVQIALCVGKGFYFDVTPYGLGNYFSVVHQGYWGDSGHGKKHFFA